jgi:hypothetical protein
MKVGFAVLGAALFVGACQTTGTTGQSVQQGPVGQTDRWEFWYVGGDGYTRAPTDTTDWSQGRVQGTDGTTLVVDCNGNDPTAFVLLIEGGARGYDGMAGPFGIEVRAGGRTILREDHPGVVGNRNFEASKRLSAAMRKGSNIEMTFADGSSVDYTLRGSSRIMNMLGCEPA